MVKWTVVIMLIGEILRQTNDQWDDFRRWWQWVAFGGISVGWLVLLIWRG